MLSRIRIAIALGCCILYCLSSYALPPEVLSQVKKTNPLVITDTNRDDIWKLRPGPKQLMSEYVILNTSFDKLESEMVEVLREYVRNGRGILISAPLSGNRVFPEIEFTGRNYKTEETKSHTCDSDAKESWMRSGQRKSYTVYEPLGSANRHPLNTAIKIVVVFDSYAGKDLHNTVGWYYWGPWDFSIENNPSALPILLRERKGENVCCAAAYNFGAGRILLISGEIVNFPLIQNKYSEHLFDTERFAVNVDQWLAGFRIPGSASGGIDSGINKEKTQYDSVVLKNGDNISGQIQNESLEIKTSYASVSFRVNEISKITVEGGGSNTDVIILSNGDRLSGMLQTPLIKILIPSGTTLDIEKDKIKDLLVVPRSGSTNGGNPETK